MLDAVGDPLTNLRIYLELHNSYWPELDLPEEEEEDDDCYYCEFCGGEICEDFSTCTCEE